MSPELNKWKEFNDLNLKAIYDMSVAKIGTNDIITTEQLIANEAIREYIDCDKLAECVLNVIISNSIITDELIVFDKKMLENAIKTAFSQIHPYKWATFPPGIIYKTIQKYESIIK